MFNVQNYISQNSLHQQRVYVETIRGSPVGIIPSLIELHHFALLAHLIPTTLHQRYFPTNCGILTVYEIFDALLTLNTLLKNQVSR